MLVNQLARGQDGPDLSCLLFLWCKHCHRGCFQGPDVTALTRTCVAGSPRQHQRLQPITTPNPFVSNWARADPTQLRLAPCSSSPHNLGLCTLTLPCPDALAARLHLPMGRPPVLSKHRNALSLSSGRSSPAPRWSIRWLWLVLQEQKDSSSLANV